MYQFSRSIYRDLAPRMNRAVDAGRRAAARQDVLEACEGTVKRLVYDGRYFARPARSLFVQVREHFPLTEQAEVYRVISRYLTLAQRYLESLPEGSGLNGARRCRASTRRGTPCQREPLPGRDYCPSHKHLEEPFEEIREVSAAA